MRGWLEFRGCEFAEHDVELDRAALARMRELTGGQPIVPGRQGRGCVAGEK